MRYPGTWAGVVDGQIASSWCVATALRDAASGSSASGAPAAVSPAQRTAALEFLSAVASGDPQAVALAIHPDDLRALRLRILGLLGTRLKRGEGTVRARLFGQGMPLDEIERLTDTGFYATLAYKLHLAGREYSLG